MLPLILLLFGVLAILVLALKQAFRPGLREVPGPWMCKFTDLWRYNETYHSRFFKTVQDLQKKYGNVVRYGPNIVLLSEKGMYEYVFGFKTNFAKADSFKVWEQIDNGKRVPSIVNARGRKEHADLRKPIAGIYSMTNVVTFEPKVDETVRYFLRRLDEEFINGSTADKPCDIGNWVQYFAFDVVGEIVLSRRLGFLEAGYDIDHLLEGIVGELDRRARAQQMPWIDTLSRRNPLYTWFYKPSSRFVLHARGIIQERLADEKREVKSLKNKGDFMEQFLDAQKRHPQIIDDTVLGSYVMTNILAGSDTTAVTLRSIIYYTIKTPGVLERLRKEIDEYVGSEFPVSWKTSQAMPYLDAVVKEALRIHPVGAIILERKVPESGLTLSNGLKLPAGTVVGMTPWTLNWDESLFGAEPRKFKPERWLPQPGETEEQATERINTMKRNDFSFSYGPRSCLGKHIALMEVYKLIPTLFGLLDIKFVHPEKEWEVSGQFFAQQRGLDVTLAWKAGVDKDKYLS